MPEGNPMFPEDIAEQKPADTEKPEGQFTKLGGEGEKVETMSAEVYANEYPAEDGDKDADEISA